MKTLDLHGMRNWQADEAIHIFINNNWNEEMRIITGHSSYMKSLVCEILVFYKLDFTLDNLFNMGYITIKN